MMTFAADALLLAGLACLVYAASLFHPALAWAVLGVALLCVSGAVTTSARLGENKKVKRNAR